MRQPKTLWFVGKLGVFIGIWLIFLIQVVQLYPFETMTDLKFKVSRLTQERLNEIQDAEAERENPIAKTIIGWEEVPNQQVTLENLARTVETTVLKVSEGIRHFVNENKVIQSEVMEDEDSVILSESLAYALCGSVDVIGESVVYDEKTYRVAGILKVSENIMIMETDEAKTTFQHIRLVGTNSDNLPKRVNDFQSRYGLQEGVIINYSILVFGFKVLRYIPIIIIIWISLIRFGYACEELTSFKVKKIIRWVGVLLVGYCIFKVFGSLPEHLIPSKWSDFEFWSELMTKGGDTFQAIKELPKGRVDDWTARAFVQALAWMSASFVATLVAIKK